MKGGMSQDEGISWWTVGAVQTCFFFGIAFTLTTAIFYTEDYLDHKRHCIVNFRFLFVIIQRAALQVFFTERLHSVFEGSIYAFPSRFFRIYYTAICIGALSSACWYFSFVSSGCSAAKQIVIGTTFPYFCDASSNIVLSVLFISKLKAVNKSIVDDKSEDNGGSLKIQKTVAKFTILTIVSILSSLFFLFVYIAVGIIAAVSDLLVSSFLLILSFKSYNKWYDYCCYGCRKCCEVSSESNVKNLVITS
ncbi:hypothetical protein RFI_19453 [Reticulomyxa filosa]|uniref:Uncharacterized protein n=1 Tax=Reticulomyxa filosa TaxID=46433 RepID=X6MV41_RETFI|nr:hypothetical protein RFI_19453 [Reticulomyxa filosa]|eukprot:ETO17858.1 hypothetical protein RFI_19453 [Reticulomyxa filosa]